MIAGTKAHKSFFDGPDILIALTTRTRHRSGIFFNLK